MELLNLFDFFVFASDVLECPCVEQIDTLKIIVDQNLNPTLSSLNSSKIIHYCVQVTRKILNHKVIVILHYI